MYCYSVYAFCKNVT